MKLFVIIFVINLYATGPRPDAGQGIHAGAEVSPVKIVSDKVYVNSILSFFPAVCVVVAGRPALRYLK